MKYRYFVSIRTPRGVHGVGYYETLEEAEQKAQQVRAKQRYNDEVRISEDDTPAVAKRDGVGLWL